MKRVILFLLTNLAVVLVLGIVTSLLGVDRFLRTAGLDVGALLAFAAILGFGGATISLLLSKTLARWSTGAQLITTPRTHDEAWLVETVARLADRAKIGMPEVAIYEGEPNAFATGAFRDSALVAVSTGLLRSMRREEVEAVLGHEVAHVANGDMVTMTLLQGVMNTFVIFASRALGFLIDGALNRDDEGGRRGPGVGYFVIRLVLELLLGALASLLIAWFSRQREFRADRGAAELLGQPHTMIGALARLGQLEAGALPSHLAAMGVQGRLGRMFATHPPIEQRIAALQAR
ncbi:MAG: protease HtpX [Deltaproteobacteria bacterium]|nr:protease HtpX [Deltaproteobacteria bacterium]